MACLPIDCHRTQHTPFMTYRTAASGRKMPICKGLDVKKILFAWFVAFSSHTRCTRVIIKLLDSSLVVDTSVADNVLWRTCINLLDDVLTVWINYYCLCSTNRNYIKKKELFRCWQIFRLRNIFFYNVWVYRIWHSPRLKHIYMYLQCLESLLSLKPAEI